MTGIFEGELSARREPRASRAGARARGRSPLAAAWLALALGAGACGGGSSGSEGGATLTLTPAALTFAASQDRAAPPVQNLQITFSSPDAVYVGAGFAGAAPGWARADLTGSGSAWTLRVEITDTSLAPGTYTATVRVGLLRADYSVITSREARVTYTVSSVLSASPTSLSFAYVVGGPLPAARDVALGGAGIAWTSAADHAWIETSSPGGTAPSTVQVGVQPAGLAPGTYGGTVAFSRASGGETVTVDVALTVEAPELAASATSLSFSGVNGTALGAQTVDVGLTNGAAASWTASADASWVVLSPATGSTPGSLAVSVDPSRGPLASGAHTASITLSAPHAGATLTRVIAVDLTLTKPTLAVTPASLTLGGATGRDPSARDVQLSLGTGAVAHAWTATSLQPWPTLDAAAGSVSAAGSTVAVGADVVALASGTHPGSVDFSATVNGDVVTATLPVTLALDAHRLLASDDGVAFASMPGLARLSRTLRIRDNFGAATTWSATADALWLAATPGTEPGELVLTANPADLTADAVHEATVTVAADAPGVAAETIRVGLWIGSTAPPATRSLAGAFQVVAVDPVRPYAYVHAGGTDIEVYNVFTGELVTFYLHVAPKLGSLAVSTDGTRLFAEDETNRKVVPIGIPTGTIGTGWTIAVPPETLVYSRTNGKDVVFAGAGYAYDPATGTRWDASPMYVSSASVGAASLDGTRFCYAPTGVSPHDVFCHPLDQTAADGRLIVGAARTGFAQGYDGDVAVNADGTRVYRAASVWDTASMSLVQTLAHGGSSLEVTRDGRVIVGAANWYDAKDLYVFDAAGFELASYRVAGYAQWIVHAQLGVTGDGLCVAAITDDPKLVLQIIGP